MKKIFTLLLLGCLVVGMKAQIVDASHATHATDKAVYYQAPQVDKKNTFIVISKKEQRLYVYGTAAGDTLLLAKYPACLSLNKGQKQRRGDMKTPSCPASKPFYIKAIKPASSWYHDFKDGRGSIKAYGAWFLSLHTPGHSPGHCCFYELERRYLYSGDLIYKGCLDAFYPSTDPLLFYQSVKRLMELEVSRVFPGHHKLAIPVSLIGEINEDFSQLERNGQLKQGNGLYDFGDVKIHI